MVEQAAVNGKVSGSSPEPGEFDWRPKIAAVSLSRCDSFFKNYPYGPLGPPFIPIVSHTVEMKLAASVLLIFPAFGILLYSGINLYPLMISLVFKGPISGVGMALVGLLGGGVGAVVLFSALRLALTRTGAEPFRSRQMMLFGLLFPGAGQIYARRWARGAVFLFGPFVIFSVALLIVSITAIVAPQLLSAAGGGRLAQILPASFVLLWLGSLSEGHFWAARRPSNIDASSWPCGRGVLATLGAVLFLLPTVFAFQFAFMRIMLHAKGAFL